MKIKAFAFGLVLAVLVGSGLGWYFKPVPPSSSQTHVEQTRTVTQTVTKRTASPVSKDQPNILATEETTSTTTTTTSAVSEGVAASPRRYSLGLMWRPAFNRDALRPVGFELGYRLSSSVPLWVTAAHVWDKGSLTLGARVEF